MGKSKIEVIIAAKDMFSDTFGTFGRGVRALTPSLSTLKTAALSLTAGVAAVGAAATGAVVGIGAMINSAATAQVEIGNWAERLDISTEALSDFAVAAENIPGLEIEDVGDAFQTLSENVSAFYDNTGPAIDAFKGLKIEATSLRNLAPEEQMKVVAEALSNVSNQGDKTRYTLEIFGEVGAKMLPILNQGREGLEGLRKETEKYGLVVTDDAVKASQKFKNSLGNVSRAFRGAKNAISTELMPALTPVIQKVADFVANIDWAEIATKKLKPVLDDVIKSLEEADWEEISNGVRSIAVGFGWVAKQAAKVPEAISSAMAGKRITGLLREYREMHKEAFMTYAEVEKVMQDPKQLRAKIEELERILSPKIKTFKIEWQEPEVPKPSSLIAPPPPSVPELGLLPKTESREAVMDISYKEEDLDIQLQRALAAEESSYEERKAALATWFEEQQDLYAGNAGRLLEIQREHSAISYEVERGHEIEKRDMKVEALDEFLAMTLENETASYEERKEALDEWYMGQQEAFEGNEKMLLARKKKYYKINDKIDKDHEKAKEKFIAEQRTLDTKLLAEYLATNRRLNEEDQKAAVAGYNQFWGDMMTATMLYGKDSFEFNRNLKYGQAVLAGLAAAQDAWAAGMSTGGPAAPAVAAAYLAASVAKTALQIKAIEAAQPPAAHGGLDYVPNEQTYLLQRGERVLSPRQNEDLTAAINEGRVGGEGGVVINRFNLTIEVPTAEGLVSLSRDDWEEIAQERVLPALRSLSLEGQMI